MESTDNGNKYWWPNQISEFKIFKIKPMENLRSSVSSQSERYLLSTRFWFREFTLCLAWGTLNYFLFGHQASGMWKYITPLFRTFITILELGVCR